MQHEAHRLDVLLLCVAEALAELVRTLTWQSRLVVQETCFRRKSTSDLAGGGGANRMCHRFGHFEAFLGGLLSHEIRKVMWHEARRLDALLLCVTEALAEEVRYPVHTP